MATKGTFVDTIASSTMCIDLARAGAGHRRLVELATDLLAIAVRMRDVEDLGEPAALRKLIVHYLKQFDVNCRMAGGSAAAVDDASYALVALVDETVLTVPGACRDFWLAAPLQLELFGEAVAGEEFYRRLERLTEDPAGNREVVEIYLVALALGFQGKYRLADAKERAALVTKVSEELRLTRGRELDRLSPHGRRAGARPARASGLGAALLRYGVALACAGAVAIAWAVTAWLNMSQGSATARSIQALLGK